MEADVDAVAVMEGCTQDSDVVMVLDNVQNTVATRGRPREGSPDATTRNTAGT